MDDSLLEDAIRAAEKFARAKGNDPSAVIAWNVCLSLKSLRRPEIVRRMDEARLAGARA